MGSERLIDWQASWLIVNGNEFVQLNNRHIQMREHMHHTPVVSIQKKS